MATVPGHQEIALVMGRQCQVEGITGWIRWHHLMLEVNLDDFLNCWFKGQNGQLTDQSQPFLTPLWRALRQFIQHRRAGDEMVASGRLLPPLPGPLPSDHDFCFRTLLYGKSWVS